MIFDAGRMTCGREGTKCRCQTAENEVYGSVKMLTNKAVSTAEKRQVSTGIEPGVSGSRWGTRRSGEDPARREKIRDQLPDSCPYERCDAMPQREAHLICGPSEQNREQILHNERYARDGRRQGIFLNSPSSPDLGPTPPRDGYRTGGDGTGVYDRIIRTGFQRVKARIKDSNKLHGTTIAAAMTSALNENGGEHFSHVNPPSYRKTM